MSDLTWSPPAIPARLPGWEDAFVSVLEEHLKNPFVWGLYDCLTLPADLCAAMTGVDPFPAALKGAYSTETGAARLLTRLGFKDVSGPLETAFTAIPPARARRGDCGARVTEIDGRRHVSTVIVLGNGLAVGKEADGGRAFVPVLTLAATFAIGAPRPARDTHRERAVGTGSPKRLGEAQSVGQE